MAPSQIYCNSVHDQSIGIGEARYKLTSTGTECYANAYHDAGSELSLSSSTEMGWITTNQYYWVGINTFLQDSTALDCQDDALVRLDVWKKDSSSCTADISNKIGFVEFKKNTCNLSVSCDPEGGMLFP